MMKGPRLGVAPSSFNDLRSHLSWRECYRRGLTVAGRKEIGPAWPAFGSRFAATGAVLGCRGVEAAITSTRPERAGT